MLSRATANCGEPKSARSATNLSKAIKYSPAAGAIHVALRTTGPSVELSVRDHGLGVAPERRDRIFEHFYQAHETDYQQGLGLGLYIGWQIVELHGGQIRAEFPTTAARVSS